MVIFFKYSKVEIFSVGFPSQTGETDTSTASATSPLSLPDEQNDELITTIISYALTSTSSSSNITVLIMGRGSLLPHPIISMKMAELEISVTCYFAEQFDALRNRYYNCSVMNFARSLSRCCTVTSAHAVEGKRNGCNNYFAKSLDERFFITQVKKDDIESFKEFGDEYFRYLTADSHSFGTTPTCLTKILGIYQVCPIFLHLPFLLHNLLTLQLCCT